jgi:hypothetical protein
MFDNILKSFIYSWKPSGIKRLFWIDRITLVLWALTFNIVFLNYGILFVDVPENIFNDLKLKKDGFIYHYQTIISAILAFFAATFVYKYNVYDKQQRSFLTALNVRSLISNTAGWVDNLSDTIEQRHNIPTYYINVREKFSSTISLFANLDTSVLSPDVSWHISSCLNTLRNLIGTLDNLASDNIWLDINVDLLDSSFRSASLSCRSFVHSYESINDYIDKNHHKFPPHLARDIRS